MGLFLNHNSFLLTIILVFLGVAVAILRRGREPRQLAALGVVALVLALVYFGMRPSAADSGQADDIRAQIGAGMPVLLEFQSQN